MITYIGKDKLDMAAHAAKMAGDKIREAIKLRGEARIIVATGASQFEFLEALVKEPDIDWTKVTGFHLDEYVGIPATHKASFRGYMRARFVSMSHGGSLNARCPFSPMPTHATSIGAMRRSFSRRAIS